MLLSNLNLQNGTKKMHKVKSFIAVLLVTFANDVFAAPHGAGHEAAPLSTLLWPTINFSIFLAIVIYFYIKLARPMLRDYRVELESSVMKQKNEHNMLESEHEQLRERLSSISAEKQEIVADLERDGRDLTNVILSTATEQAEKTSTSSQRRYQLEAQKVSGEVRKTLIDKVVAKVKSQISASFSPEDDEQFIKSVMAADLDKVFVKNSDRS